MSWINREQSQYENNSLSLIDAMYAYTICECLICESKFYEGDEYKSDYNNKFDFCSEKCVCIWNEENKHDYIEEEVI